MGSGIENIVLPDSLETIGDAAFQSTNIKEITIPKSVTSIEKNVFEKDVLIYCYKDSTAHKYAKDNGLNFKLLDATEDTTVSGTANRGIMCLFIVISNRSYEDAFNSLRLTFSNQYISSSANVSLYATLQLYSLFFS